MITTLRPSRGARCATSEVQGGASVDVVRKLLREYNLTLSKMRFLNSFDRIVLRSEGRTIFLPSISSRENVLVDRPGSVRSPCGGGLRRAASLPLRRLRRGTSSGTAFAASSPLEIVSA